MATYNRAKVLAVLNAKLTEAQSKENDGLKRFEEAATRWRAEMPAVMKEFAETYDFTSDQDAGALLDEIAQRHGFERYAGQRLMQPPYAHDHKYSEYRYAITRLKQAIAEVELMDGDTIVTGKSHDLMALINIAL